MRQIINNYDVTDFKDFALQRETVIPIYRTTVFSNPIFE